MKTFQVIMKSGLTRIIEADHWERGTHALEFQVNDKVTFMFRTETLRRVESFDDGDHHEVVFPVMAVSAACPSGSAA
jgi:hypothetical protein